MIISTPKISDKILIWRIRAIQVQDQWNQSIHELMCVNFSFFEVQDDYSEHLMYVSLRDHLGGFDGLSLAETNFFAFFS